MRRRSKNSNRCRKISSAAQRKYGLDKPVWQQYLLFVRNAVRLDFGYSFSLPEPTVVEIFKEQWSYSLQLGLLTFAFSLVVGVGLGIAGRHEPEHLDRLFRDGRFDFLSGDAELCLRHSAAIRLFRRSAGCRPAAGAAPHWIMPVLANSLAPDPDFAALYAREHGGRDAAELRAHGARQRLDGQPASCCVHVFKNALTPLLTVGGPLAAGLISRFVLRRKHFPHSGHRLVFRLAVQQPRLPDDYGDDPDLDCDHQRDVLDHRSAVRCWPIRA